MFIPVSAKQVDARSIRGSVLLLHFGFFLCGVATALPGALIPVFTNQWLLSDAYAGTLVSLQFCASAFGSVLVARQRAKTINLGYLLAAFGFILLGLNSRVLTFPAFAAIGGGLGLAMTSTSLFVSELYQKGRGGALSLLNFSWGVGAVLAPALVRLLSIHSLLWLLFLALAAFFTAALAGSFGLLSRHPAPQAPVASGGNDLQLRVYFAAMLFLYVGIENSMGSWVTEFAERSSTGHHLWLAPYVASFFWGALLLGRAIAPLILRMVSELTLHIAACFAAGLAALTMLVARGADGVAASAVLGGLALAPVFPLTISALVGHSSHRSRLGWVFATAGFGGAVFTGLEGWLSTTLHSLRSSFVLSAAGAVAMLCLTALYPRVWRSCRK